MTKKDAIDIIKSECYVFNPLNFDRSTMVNTALDMAVKALEQEPKTGHWIADVDRWGDIVTTVNGYRCSECNAFDTDKDNYCPSCGLKMVEPQESEVVNERKMPNM